MPWVIASAGCKMAIFALMINAAPAGEPHVSTNTRPPDSLAERLERPRPEQDSVRNGAPQAQLTRSEVVRLAHTTAKQKLGMLYEKYDLKGVIFDQQERSWSVTFTSGTSTVASDTCLIVSVHDNSRETKSKPCQ